MKKLLLIVSFFCATVCLSTAQFAGDVIIQNDPLINQQRPVITSAFNGWLYSAYITQDTTATSGGITIRKSTDRGLTWQTIDSYFVNGVAYRDAEVLVAGTDTNNLTLYVAGINYNMGSNTFVAFIDRYNATTGVFIGSNFNHNTGSRTIYDLSLATDYEFPGVGASPYSVAILVSEYSSSYDSLNLFVSVDGGASFTVKQPVAKTGSYFRKTSLSYGRSSSGSNGRYFAAWEMLASSTDRIGHIYTSRSASTIDGSWNTPICLDSVSSTMINLCRNPRIATSHNNTDNDSGSVTAIVLVDRDYNGNASDYDLLGFYNKRAHFTGFWNRLDINNTGENDMQSDIVFDNDSLRFTATYLDSTNQKLVYLHNDWNLVAPSTWAVASTQYNDVAPNTNAYPRLAYSPAEKGTAVVWTRTGLPGRGVAMFDANYTGVYLGISDNNEPTLNISTYPNPTADYLNIHLDGIESANLTLIDNNGQVMQVYNMVTDNQMISMTEFANGVYFLKFEHNGKSVTKKIIKN